MIENFYKIKAKLLPIPSRPYYCFGISDITKILAPLRIARSYDIIKYCWNRVVCDRISDTKEEEFVRKFLEKDTFYYYYEFQGYMQVSYKELQYKLQEFFNQVKLKKN